ncbi:unnamed protein product [Pleuronectes platessa]|uniref:Uncharacterized protein n=1 Tax=Pleuronectes platessa TaxID=8262 RepID=A0A9N7UW56_PLEPL|nr:unnamed protein product [Pleuronectes platessa]
MTGPNPEPPTTDSNQNNTRTTRKRRVLSVGDWLLLNVTRNDARFKQLGTCLLEHARPSGFENNRITARSTTLPSMLRGAVTFCAQENATRGGFQDPGLEPVELEIQGYQWFTESAARRQPRRTAGRAPPRERRVPPAGAVAEVIREKGPTRVQSRCRRPPYPVPSNGPPSAPAMDTAPRSKRKKESPRTTDAVRHSGIGPPPPKKRRGVPHSESPAAWRGGRLLPQPRHLPSGLTTNTNDIGESQD